MKRKALILILTVITMLCLLTACTKPVGNVTLTFVVDGNVYSTIETTGAEAINIPNDPEKQGYTFDSWYWDKDTWQKPFTANSLLDTPIKSNLSVYAKFNTIDYTIAYNANGGTHENPSTYTIENTVALKNAEKQGYTFDGWYNGETKVTDIAKGSTGNLELEAKFTKVDYTITYENVNGATNPNPTGYSIESEKITLQDLTLEGYTFDGWYDGENKVTEIATGSTGNVTLTAKWTENKYDITYHNIENATNSNPTSFGITNLPITLVDAEKNGYRFIGWFDKKVDGEKVTVIENKLEKIDLYARWEAITYYATFMADGVQVGEKLAFNVENMQVTAPAVPEKAGYTGKWEDYTLGLQDITVNAVYSPITYSISYKNTKDATNTNSTTYTIESETITLAGLTVAGYTFDGWYNGDTKVETIAKGTYGNLELTAKWTAITYYATFMADGVQVGEKLAFNVENMQVTAPSVPEKIGYTGKWEDYTLSLQDITVNAVYTPISYTITYANTKEATNNNPATYTIESENITLAGLSVAGYIFDGWYNGENKVATIAKGTYGNLELTAKWTAITYYATFMADGVQVGEKLAFNVENMQVTAPTVPEKAGYTGKWEDYILVLQDLTVNAVYTPITYTITYANTKGLTTENPTAYTIESENITLAGLTVDGYTFDGWYNGETKVETIAKGTYGNLELTAKWTAITYYATFMVDGAQVGEKLAFNVENMQVTAPAVPEKAGYTGEWEKYTLGLQDITVNAVYTPITYTISYANTKGLTTENPTTYTIESENITLAGLTVAGYTFDGWYNGETKVETIAKGTYGNLELTAKWAAIEYKLTFIYDDAIGSYQEGKVNRTTYTVEDSFTFEILLNDTIGYTFNGWYTAKNLGTGEKVDGIEKGTIGDKIFYAQWGIETFTITYHNVNGATNTNPTTYTIETDTFEINAISLVGYNFDGWFTDEQLTNPAQTTIEKGSVGNLDLYAKWTAIPYNIEYVLYGGSYESSSNPATYTIEDEITFINPSLTGYEFMGWYTLAEGGQKVTGITLGSTGNKTFYARFGHISTISFESNGGTMVESIVAVEGEKVTKPQDPTKDYYDFAGWYNDEALTKAYTFNVMPHENLTLYAKWTPTIYNISYELNGGVNNSQNPKTYTVEDAKNLLAPEKVGYTFIAWFTDSEFQSAPVTEIALGTHGDLVFYANYSINKYTISFNSNGGTDVEPIEQNYATEVTAPEAPAKNGYTFAGWYSDEALTKAYTFTTMPASNITLHAKWDVAIYNITYNLNGGTNSSANPATYKITSNTITLASPSKEGYTFVGWVDSENNPATQIIKGSYGDKEFTATWQAITYTVTYELGDERATHENATEYTIETDIFLLADPVLAGYTFGGWYKEQGFVNSVTTVAGGEIGNKTIYAKWTVNSYDVYLDGEEDASYTVSFNLCGGEGEIASQTVTETNALTYPSIPTKTGYIFAGWYDNAEYTGGLFNFTQSIVKNYTLYAKWVEVSKNQTAISVGETKVVSLNGTNELVYVFVPLVSGNVSISSSGTIDTLGSLYNSQNVLIAQDDDTKDQALNFLMVYNVTAGKPYYIKVRAFGTGVTGNVELTVSGNTSVADGGLGLTPTKTKITYDSNFTLTPPTAKEGYKFLGYMDENGVMYTDNQGNSLKAWDKAQNTVLYSNWERTVYMVTFETSGGSAIEPVQLAYSERFDIGQYITTRAGYTFNGWYLNGEEYNATTMPDHNITLTAYWKTFALGSIKYNTDKTAVSVNDEITAELFDAICLDTNGNLAIFTVTISGTQEVGNTISVRLVASSGNKTKQVTITNVKVYGEPNLSITYDRDYINLSDEIDGEFFGAIGVDTFGEATKIEIYQYEIVDVPTSVIRPNGEWVTEYVKRTVLSELNYNPGEIINLAIVAVDVAGNTTVQFIDNIKVYGKPKIEFNEEKVGISVNDTLTSSLFNATATDSFGKELEVVTTLQSGITRVGNTVVICFSTTDSKGNEASINFSVKIYGAPTLYSPTTTEIKESDELTAELLGVRAVDSFGESLEVNLSIIKGLRRAGNIIIVKAIAIDNLGHDAYLEFELKVYGTPSIEYSRNGIKLGEDASETIVVSFDLNYEGATNGPESQLITTANGIKYPTVPIRSNYLFKGWYTSSDCYTLYDFTANLTSSITLYAGWQQVTGYSGYVLDITRHSNSYVPYTYSTNRTTSGRYYYTYFTVLVTGTYRLYYKNGSTNYNYATMIYAYNQTRSSSIISSTSVTSTSYASISFDANAGDIIYIRTNPYSTKYSTTFSLFVGGGDKLPSDGGTIIKTAANKVLNATAVDSFGRPLEVTATLKSGSHASGNYVSYTLTATDHLGNTYAIDTAPLGVYDANDIQLDYLCGMSDIVKLCSCGEEFNASAYDSFGDPCKISIEAADGFTLKGGSVISLYIVATDKAGNIKKSELISNIKVYDAPTITLVDENTGYIISDDTDISFLFTAHDSFGEEIYASITADSALSAGKIVNITVEATDDAGYTTKHTYHFGVISSDKRFVELYVDGELWDLVCVEDVLNYSLPIPEDWILPFISWNDENGNVFTNQYGDGVALLSATKLYAYSNYIAIRTVSDLNNVRNNLNGNYVLLNDIDLADATFEPIGNGSSFDWTSVPFAGIFDGNGYTISKWSYRYSNDFAGLFGYNAGIIKNLGVANFNLGGDISGGLVAWNTGEIINCYAIGTVEKSGYTISGSFGGLVATNYGKIENCHSLGDITSSITPQASGRYCAVGGLVGRNEGTIKNSYSDVAMTLNYGGSSSDSSSSDLAIAGGLVGYNYGVILNSYTTGNVSASSSTGGTPCAGGLVAANGGGIINCYSTGNVSGSFSYHNTSPVPSANVGGLVGSNSRDIMSCYATGKVKIISYYGSSGQSYARAGGLVGSNRGNINNSFASGQIDIRFLSSSSSSTGYAGGLLGYNSGRVSNCFAFGKVSISSSYAMPTRLAGGVVGYNEGKIENCYRSYSQTITVDMLLNNGTINDIGDITSIESFKSANWLKSNIWTFESEVWVFELNCFPKLYWQLDRILDEKIIATRQDLMDLQGQILTMDYQLESDIDLTGIAFTPMILYGVFDGKDHIISGFTPNIDNIPLYIGLFGINGGTIKNLAVNCNINSQIDGGSIYVGGLVGYNIAGIVSDCYTTGSVKADCSNGANYTGGLVGYNSKGRISSSFSSASVAANAIYYGYAGGLVGNNDGIIDRCYATGKVTASGIMNYAGGLVCFNDSTGYVTDCYANGTVKATDGVGGLVYHNEGYISNCYATGSVSSGSSEACIGGLVGYQYAGVISSSYATGAVACTVSSSTSKCYIGGLVGKVSSRAAINNCYKYTGQSITSKFGTVCDEGVDMTLSDAYSSQFHIETLGWNSKCWSFEGTYPTLSN